MEIKSMDACYPDKSRTAGAILSYLSAHPDAADSVEGIVRWWLLERKSELSSAFLKEVLSDLVTQGLVEAHRETTGTVLYRAHRRQK